MYCQQKKGRQYRLVLLLQDLIGLLIVDGLGPGLGPGLSPEQLLPQQWPQPTQPADLLYPCLKATGSATEPPWLRQLLFFTPHACTIIKKSQGWSCQVDQTWARQEAQQQVLQQELTAQQQT